MEAQMVWFNVVFCFTLYSVYIDNAQHWKATEDIISIQFVLAP